MLVHFNGLQVEYFNNLYYEPHSTSITCTTQLLL